MFDLKLQGEASTSPHTRIPPWQSETAKSNVQTSLQVASGPGGSLKLGPGHLHLWQMRVPKILKRAAEGAGKPETPPKKQPRGGDSKKQELLDILEKVKQNAGKDLDLIQDAVSSDGDGEEDEE